MSVRSADSLDSQLPCSLIGQVVFFGQKAGIEALQGHEAFDLEDLSPQKAVKIVFLIGMGRDGHPAPFMDPVRRPLHGHSFKKIPFPYLQSKNQEVSLHGPVFQAL